MSKPVPGRAGKRRTVIVQVSFEEVLEVAGDNLELMKYLYSLQVDKNKYDSQLIEMQLEKDKFESQFKEMQALLRLEVSEQKRKVAWMETEVMRKENEVVRKELQNAQLAAKLGVATTELLRVRGLLHVHGLLEHAENELGPNHCETRKDMWLLILDKDPKLSASLSRKAGWNGQDYAAEKIAELYGHLSDDMNIQRSVTVLDIGGPCLSPEHVEALKCIAEAYHVMYKVIPAHAGQQDEEV